MDLSVRIGPIKFKNPVWVASGTFGYGEEFADFLDLDEIGAVVTKTVTLEPREGNRPPRVVETPSGLLNSIGLENKGMAYFLEEYFPRLKRTAARVIVSIAGSNGKDFAGCAAALADAGEPDMIEVNLSCPNVRHEGARHELMAQDAKSTEKITASVRKKVKCPVMAKLTPNVTDVAEIAAAAENAGADAVSLVNTYMGLAVDVEKMEPALGNAVGGLSGPAIKPMALKAVHDAYRRVRIPVVGIGGIMTGSDVAEFMLCGAAAVQVGTANLADPSCYRRILSQFTGYLERTGIKKASGLTGRLKT